MVSELGCSTMADSSNEFSASSLTITQCVTLKLSSSNYLLWKTQVERFLSSHMLLGYVTGATQRPTSTVSVRRGDITAEEANLEFIKWVRTDQLVMAWILGTLSEDALRVVYGLQSSHEVWLSLAKQYNRVSASRKFDLQRRLQTVSKEGKTMVEYLQEMKTICDQLDSIGFPVPDQEKIYGVLNGLGKEYQPVAAVIENALDACPGPTYEDVVYRLTGFDDRLKTYDVQTTITPHMAFAVTNTNDSANYSNYSGYRGRGGYSNRFGSNRGRGSYSTRGRGFPQQISSSANGAQSSDNSNRPTCQICGKFGHGAMKCYKRFDISYQNEEVTNAMAAMRVSDEPQYNGTEWYPDTGASAHITNSTQNLQNSQDFRGNDSVMIADGNFLPITHIGSVPLTTMSGQANKATPDTRKPT